jgi:cytochrome P450
MGTLTARAPLIGEAAPSPAGPIDAAELADLARPPAVAGSRLRQVLQFNQRQIEFVFRARRRHGEVFAVRIVIPGENVFTSHPDHVRSLFTTQRDLAPSLTGESPLRPVVGSTSVLTALGERHMRQRKLLLPHFHGDAIAAYERLIVTAAQREITSWRPGTTIELAPRMQAVTLDVIMGGIFGIEGRPPSGSAEDRLRRTTARVVDLSTKPLAQVAELMNIGHAEPVGLQRLVLAALDRAIYAVIRSRRAESGVQERRDILSLLIRARTEDGETLTDRELRDELLTLVLAGHETTANQLAWTWERLVRTPAALERLVESVRGETQDAPQVIEQTIQEGMRTRPVIPIIGRRVVVPWRLGPYGVDAQTAVSMSILLLHHREDLYPDPFAFRPERWEGHKPGTYEWIPFGGGVRRCLGATLAMAEQRIVMREIARAVDLAAPGDGSPEHALHRNVTMIPARGGQVVVRSTRNA